MISLMLLLTTSADALQFKVANKVGIAHRTKEVIPLIGYGVTDNYSGSSNLSLKESVVYYLRSGGRTLNWHCHIDNDVGAALQASGVSPSEIFLSSCLWGGGLRNAKITRQAVEEKLKDTGVKTLDLLMLHDDNEWAIEAFKGLLDAKAEGLVKNVGVMDFTMERMNELQQKYGVYPDVWYGNLEPNDVLNSSSIKAKTFRWCQERGISVISIGWTDLSLESEAIHVLAKKYGKSFMEVSFRWAMDRGITVFPCSRSPGHLRELAKLQEFGPLTENELALIERRDAHM